MFTLPQSAPMPEHAMEIAASGWYVFPLSPMEKVPYKDTNGFLDASNTPYIVEKEFKKYGTNSNIGIATGQSGLVVVDIDPKNGGDESWDTLCRGFGKFETLEAETGSGGRHCYFLADTCTRLASGVNSFGKDFPGVDVRATGGYVVAPPSLHPNGNRYVWDAGTESIARIPQDILTDLFEKQSVLRESPKQALVGKVQPGSRNKELTRVAGALRRHGLNAEMMFPSLMAINKMSCVPPLAEREVWQICNSIARKAPEEELFGGKPVLQMVIKAAADLRTVRTEWLVEGRVPRSELTIFEGRGGLGKSTVALDILARASTHKALPGGNRLERPYRSLLVAEEDSGGLVRARLSAAGADLNRVFIVEGMQGIEDDTLHPIRFPRDTNTLASIIKEHKIDVVYIDALFNAFDGQYSANSSQDVRIVVGGLAKLAKDTNTTVIATRHVGKADRHAKDRGLGSVDIGNVARSVVQFDEESEGSEVRVMRTVKNNYGKHPEDLMYEFEESMQYDDLGQPNPVARIRWFGLEEHQPVQNALPETSGLLDYARTALA